VADALKVSLQEGARRQGLLFLSLAAAGVGFAINLQLSPQLPGRGDRH
jgi:hypothetical protein